MKKKEREHLKADPLKEFIGKSFESLKHYKREILIGVLVVVGALVIFTGIKTYNYLSLKSENRIYGEVLQVKNDETLTIDQKIEKIGKIDEKGGIAASAKLFLASLYFEKGDINKAKEMLDKFSSSSIKVVQEQKSILEADILVASKKYQEALDLLNKLYTDSKTEVGKDFVLLKMAKIQIKNGQKDMAKTNLTKVTDEFEQSFYSYEAQQILDSFEK